MEVSSIRNVSSFNSRWHLQRRFSRGQSFLLGELFATDSTMTGKLVLYMGERRLDSGQLLHLMVERDLSLSWRRFVVTCRFMSEHSSASTIKMKTKVNWVSSNDLPVRVQRWLEIRSTPPMNTASFLFSIWLYFLISSADMTEWYWIPFTSHCPILNPQWVRNFGYIPSKPAPALPFFKAARDSVISASVKAWENFSLYSVSYQCLILFFILLVKSLSGCDLLSCCIRFAIVFECTFGLVWLDGVSFLSFLSRLRVFRLD